MKVDGLEDHIIEFLKKDFRRPLNVRSGCCKSRIDHICYHIGSDTNKEPDIQDAGFCWDTCPGHKYKYM
jgi:hypothetical protein